MRSTAIIIALLFVVSIFMLGCGGSQTPKECLADAKKAWSTDKNYDEAIVKYRQILDWPSENKEQPDKTQRFKASLYMIKCKILGEDIKGAIADLKEIKESFKDVMTPKNYNAVIGDLMEKKAKSEAIDVLVLAAKHFPEQKDLFDKNIEILIKMGLSDEDKGKLKGLGYL